MRPMHILLAALLGMMGGLALGDELKPWPGPPAEQKPADPPAAEPAKPADKPKEQPKPAPQKKPPVQEDESDPCRRRLRRDAAGRTCSLQGCFFSAPAK